MEDDRAQLERELQELREAVLRDWVRVTEHTAGAAKDMERSLSWRITRPLRLARTYQRKLSEVGPMEATRLAVSLVAGKREQR